MRGAAAHTAPMKGLFSWLALASVIAALIVPDGIGLVIAVWCFIICPLITLCQISHILNKLLDHFGLR